MGVLEALFLEAFCMTDRIMRIGLKRPNQAKLRTITVVYENVKKVG